MTKSIAQLEQISKDTYASIALRMRGLGDMPKKDTYERHVLVCAGTGCASSSSLKIAQVFQEEIDKHGKTEKVQIIKTGCFGLCELGPICIVYPEGTFYSQLEVKDIPQIVESHLVNGKPLNEFVYNESLNADGTAKPLSEINFYKKQHRVALANCGVIDPENIDEYLALDGYSALRKCLQEKTPSEVIEIVKASGLRGRGGAGFPTGLKWQFTAGYDADQKYVACNADEGDPGAFMDRSILEGDPHAVLEAMAIAGYAVGASIGYIYIRAEYPIAVGRLEVAIKQAQEYGVLGENLFGTGFNFKVGLRLGAGAFVCGEETALIASIEGQRGEPRPRPPFPAERGIFGKPTMLNNVETYANITQIIRNGAQWYNDIGTETSKGTKVFALGGKIKNTGLVEVPMGTTLREIVEDVGGGVPNGKAFKAAQTGGPSGGCIPASLLDTPIDYENLGAVGSMMGSGGLIVMDEDNCMVDIAKFYLDFTVEESCGKCPPCRIGTRRMLEILERITEGKGKPGDIEDLEQLGNNIKISSLCALGQTAPNPVLSTIAHFRDEYEAHVNEKRCPAGQCKSLRLYSIIEEKCIGCSACARVCPTNAITGKVKTPYIIDQDKCIKCGACIDKCKFSAILVK